MIGICSCGTRKLKTTSAAIDMYNGAYHRMTRRYLQTKFSDPQIFIVSAKHGLLRLTDVIEPYDIGPREKTVTSAVIRNQAQRMMIAHQPVLYIGSRKYYEILREVFPEVTAPLIGHCLWEQSVILTRAIKQHES